MSHPSLSKPPPSRALGPVCTLPGARWGPCSPHRDTRSPRTPAGTEGHAPSGDVPSAPWPGSPPGTRGDGPVAGSAGGSRLSPAHRVPHPRSSPAAAPGTASAAPRRDAHGAVGRLRSSFTTTQNSHGPTPGCRTALTRLADVSSVRPKCGRFAAEMQRVDISCACSVQVPPARYRTPHSARAPRTPLPLEGQGAPVPSWGTQRPGGSTRQAPVARPNPKHQPTARPAGQHRHLPRSARASAPASPAQLVPGGAAPQRAAAASAPGSRLTR